MNIATILDGSANYFPERYAVIDGDRHVHYAELKKDTDQIASALTNMGLAPGEHVALCASNSYEWLVFYFGALKAGAVTVTFSHQLLSDALSQVLKDCAPKFLLTIKDKLPDLSDYREQSYAGVVVCDKGDISFSDLMSKGDPSFTIVDRDRHETAAILYTGGTTGTPKGAMLSHENLMASIANVARNERSTEKDRALCFLPLNHVFAQVHIMNSTIFSAGGLIIQNGFDLDVVLSTIEKYDVTKFYAVPTVYVRLLKMPDLKARIKTLRYCFSAASSMAVEVVREWKEKTGLNIYEAYGMTESASMVTYNHYYQHEVGSIGTPASLVEVRICDTQGNVLPQGEEGEICICGPNMFKGYLNNPEETEAAFWGDWFRSGDIGMINEKGYLFILDRLKDLIITGGENVYPREVEDLLYERKEVLECAVVGLPDPEYGERVTAFITPQPGQEIDPAALKDFLKQHLPGFKVPKAFITMEQLPKSSAGKLLKREIKRMYA